ncbi:hypothetical protein GCM10009111_08240 [Colwellia asteriadis]|uniref:Uncharacterized protein n=2 Tax=Colwellia asteriadis TaxID=517723 RepID=A0ABN1L490_9GAMM
MISATTDFPMFVLYIVVAWNLFWLNCHFLLNFVFNRFKGAYIDREKQTISFTWRVKGNPEKNEFGHATFLLTDIEAFYSKQIKNQQGGSSYTLCLAHKDHYTYSGAFLQINIRDNPHNPNHCQHKWELIQRFADNTLPLPDMPELEAFRHLDPLTVAYDKKHNRPEYHWRKMHVKHQRAIEEALEEMVHNFSFESAIHDPTCAKKELEKPWLIWPIEQKYFDDELAVPLWRKRAGVVFRQLTIGI